MLAAIRGVGHPLNKPVTLHAFQCVGHRRLLDLDNLTQFLLGYSILFVQGQ